MERNWLEKLGLTDNQSEKLIGSSTGPAGGESELDGISKLGLDGEFGKVLSSSCLSSIA
jgi:hypothetical protein